MAFTTMATQQQPGTQPWRCVQPDGWRPAVRAALIYKLVRSCGPLRSPLLHLQGAVKLLQSQAEDVARTRDALAADRDALAAERDALAGRLEAATAEAAAAQRDLRRQLDAAWQDAANKAARVADLELLLQVCAVLTYLSPAASTGS